MIKSLCERVTDINIFNQSLRKLRIHLFYIFKYAICLMLVLMR